MINRKGKFIQINKPEWFKNKTFLSCLEDDWTWYSIQKSPEFWDTIFYYEKNAGSFNHLPYYIAEELKSICNLENFEEGLIWITNLAD
jgi:hypothetical protein